jgi:hypothetical protein
MPLSNTAFQSSKLSIAAKHSIPAVTRPVKRHGFPSVDWLAAKKEARAIMIETCKLRSTITYTELVERIHSIKIAADDHRLRFLLDEISVDEDKAGCGLLSAVVVHAVGNWMPGKGFFEMAARRGRDVSDREACWIDELLSLYIEWSK